MNLFQVDSNTHRESQGPPFQCLIGENVAKRFMNLVLSTVNKLGYNKDWSVLCSVGTDGSVIKK